MKGKVTKTGYKKNSPDVNNDYNIIPSGRITMRDVQFPVYGVDEYGNAKMMYPGGEYQFPGSTVFELPMYQIQGETQDVYLDDVDARHKMNFLDRIKRFGWRVNDRIQQRRNFNKSKDFLEGWHTSPMYQEMRQAEMQNPLELNETDWITDNRLKNLKRTNRFKINYGAPEEGEERTSAYYSPLEDNLLLVNRQVTPSHYGSKDLSGLFTHELTHATDHVHDGKFYLPAASQINILNNAKEWSEGMREFEEELGITSSQEQEELDDFKSFGEYVQDPTEVRARLNVVRQAAKEAGVYDPYTEKLNEESFQKLQELFSPDSDYIPYGADQFDQLRTFIYPMDGDLMEALNTISARSSGQDIPMAQLGGMRRGKVDRILNENRDLNFVQRMYQPGTPSIMIPGQDGPSTHFMESADGFVYPTVVQMPDGNLQYLGEGAYDHAMQTGEYIQFPNDRQARRFAKSYKKGTGVLKEYQTAGQYNGDWRHVGNYGYTAPQDATYVAPPVSKTVIDQADVNRQAARQPTISQYKEPSTTEYVLNKLANPMTTLGYVARGQDVPDMVPDKDNPIDYAFDVINPAAWIDYGNKSINALSQGDFMGAGLNALAALPAVPAIKAAVPTIKAGVNTVPKYINPNYFKPNSNMMYRGLGREGMEDALQSGVFRPKPADMIPSHTVDLGNAGTIDFAKRFDKTYYSPYFKTADQYGNGFIAEVPRDAAQFNRRYRGQDWSMHTTKQIPVSQGRILEKDWWSGYKPVDIPKTTSSVEHTVPTLNKYNAQMRALAEEVYQPSIDNSYVLDRYTPRTMSQSFGDLENFRAPFNSQPLRVQRDPIPLLPKSHGYNPALQEQKQGGEMIRRADGSYSRRGLWDNIRANKGSGKKPTKEMLEQERKIRKAQMGIETGVDIAQLITPPDTSSLTPVRSYYEQWQASPRYNEMLRNSTNAIEPVEITKKLTPADKVGRFVRKVANTGSQFYLGTDWPEIKKSLLKNKVEEFYKDNNVSFTPGLSYTSISEGRQQNLNSTPNKILPLAQEYIDTGVGGHSLSSNGQIKADPAFYINPTSWGANFYHNELLPHELSHSTDRPLANSNERLIPQADIDQIKSRINPDADPHIIPGFWSKYGQTPKEGAVNYYSNPTEVRARLNEIRYNLNKEGVDIFNKQVTQEDLDQLNTRSAVGDLQDVYSNEDLLWLLNNISKKDPSKQSNYAQVGGEMVRKAQDGVQVPPMPNLYQMAQSPQDRIAIQTPTYARPNQPKPPTLAEYSNYLQSQQQIGEAAPDLEGLPWLWDKLTNPVNTISYAFTEQDLPNKVGGKSAGQSSGNFNALSVPVAAVNPFEIVNSGINLVENVSEGNWEAAAWDALGVAPGLRGVKPVARAARSAPRVIRKGANNLYKLNPKAVKTPPFTTIARIQQTGQTGDLVMSKYYDDLLNSGRELTPSQRIKAIGRSSDSRRFGFGQGFSMDPADVNYYAQARGLTPQTTQVLSYRMPTSQLDAFRVSNLSDDARRAYNSAKPTKEFLLPIDDILKADNVPLDQVGSLQKAMGIEQTPHWWRGYPTNLQKGGQKREPTDWVDYLNPMNWFVTNRDQDGDFKQAFRAARNAGDDEFMWYGTRYTTDYAPQSDIKTVPVKKKEVAPAEIDLDFDTLKRGVSFVESRNGKYMWNPESSATGLYGQRFSEIQDTDVYSGTRENFRDDLDAQNRIFELRFNGELPGSTTGLKKDALDLYKEYYPIVKKNNISPVEIAALSNFLGRQGTRYYLGYVLRDGRSLEDVFPNLYGSDAGQSNKTPDQYLDLFREAAYAEQEVGGEIENHPDYSDHTSYVNAWKAARRQLGAGQKFKYGGRVMSTSTPNGQ